MNLILNKIKLTKFQILLIAFQNIMQDVKNNF